MANSTDVCPLSILKGDYRVLNKKSRRTYVLRTSFNFYPNVCPFLLKSCRRRRHRRLRSSTSVTAAAARLLLSTKRPKSVWSHINPNWHETGQIYPPYNFWIGWITCSWHRSLQKFEFQLFKSFVMIIFACSKVVSITLELQNLS